MAEPKSPRKRPALLAATPIVADVPKATVDETPVAAKAPAEVAIDPPALAVPVAASEPPAPPPEPPATPVTSAADEATTKPAPADAAAILPSPAAAPAPLNPVDPAPVEPTSRGFFEMASAFPQIPTAEATEKAKAMFGDMNGRAKAAMEKSVKLGEEMSEFAKGNVEAVVQSGRVAAKGAEALAQEAAETMKKHFESATATMKSFASVKSPTELFQLQSDAAKSYFDSAVADMSKYTEQLMKLAGDVTQPLSSRYSLAMEKMKTTTTL